MTAAIGTGLAKLLAFEPTFTTYTGTDPLGYVVSLNFIAGIWKNRNAQWWRLTSQRYVHLRYSNYSVTIATGGAGNNVTSAGDTAKALCRCARVARRE